MISGEMRNFVASMNLLPNAQTMRSYFLIFFVLSCASVLGYPTAGKYFDFSSSAKDTYLKATGLRLNEAHASLAHLKQNEPDNLIPILIENYLDFLAVFVSDRADDYKKLSKNMDPRLDKIARGDRRSPYYLYCQAEIRLQWAFLRTRFGDYLSAMSDTKQAYALLEENQRRFPNFVANQKSLGIIHALVGNVPEEYRWVLKVLGGMNGTTEQGLNELRMVLARNQGEPFIFEEETLLAYAFLLAHLNNQVEEGWNTLKNSQLNPRASLLAAYAMATVAMRAGHNEEAIRLLQEAPNSGGYAAFPQLQYLLGLAKLRRLDRDADQSLRAFIAQFKGENGIKEGLQKLAWHKLLFGSEAEYHTYMEQAKREGSARTEPDKAVAREAQKRELPDKTLLQARLLFDGGYFQRAHQLIANQANRYAGTPKWSLEYHYRMGRIAHKQGKMQDAVRFYRQTIENGMQTPWYFSCGAALYLGLLYEQQKDFAKAKSAYEQCLSIKPEEYAGGLHAQAKAGLGRIKGGG